MWTQVYVYVSPHHLLLCVLMPLPPSLLPLWLFFMFPSWHVRRICSLIFCMCARRGWCCADVARGQSRCMPLHLVRGAIFSLRNLNWAAVSSFVYRESLQQGRRTQEQKERAIACVRERRVVCNYDTEKHCSRLRNMLMQCTSLPNRYMRCSCWLHKETLYCCPWTSREFVFIYSV